MQIMSCIIVNNDQGREWGLSILHTALEIWAEEIDQRDTLYLLQSGKEKELFLSI